MSALVTWISLWRWRWWRDAGAEVARRGGSAAGSADEPGIALLRRQMHEIHRVARWLPQSRCLDRALALIEWADAHAIPAELCIGVRRVEDRVQAHAWVQSGTIVFDPDPEATRQFVRLQHAGAGIEFDR